MMEETERSIKGTRRRMQSSRCRQNVPCFHRASPLVLFLAVMSLGDVTTVIVSALQSSSTRKTTISHALKLRRAAQRPPHLQEPHSSLSRQRAGSGNNSGGGPVRVRVTAEGTAPSSSSHSTTSTTTAAAGSSSAPNVIKIRNNNPAMGDIDFLRKRTKHILEATDPEQQQHTGADFVSNKKLSGRSMRINRKTFHFLIDSWAFSGELDAADQALSLLQRMEDLTQDDDSSYEHLAPDVRSYTKAMNAIARSPTKAMAAGQEAEELLAKMRSREIQPNTFTYTAVVEAHANSGAPGSADRCAELCEEMVQLYEQEEGVDVKPTARAFNAAISAHAKSCEYDPDACSKAVSIFERLEQVYEKHGGPTGPLHPEAKPVAFNYNAVISAFANAAAQDSGDGDEADRFCREAEQVLVRMENRYKTCNDKDVKPTTVSYNAVIDAYAKAGTVPAAENAEALLERMMLLDESSSSGIKPNTRSFNSVINAWAKASGRVGDEGGAAATRAQDLLDRMENLYEQTGNDQVQPDAHSFCTVINALARSQRSGKAERAHNLFREMKTLYQAGNSRLKPNVVAANAVMNACAFTMTDGVQEQNRAMEIAHATLREMKTDPQFPIQPDQVTYGTLLKVCGNLMPACSSRQKLVEALFQKACKDGQVGPMVLQQLRTILLNDDDDDARNLYLELVGAHGTETGEIPMEDLPSEWWCNVVEGKWRRRQRNLN